jgi:hypothetical protein
MDSAGTRTCPGNRQGGVAVARACPTATMEEGAPFGNGNGSKLTGRSWDQRAKRPQGPTARSLLRVAPPGHWTPPGPAPSCAGDRVPCNGPKVPIFGVLRVTFRATAPGASAVPPGKIA